MAKPQTIYCPRCGRRVGGWDGRATIDMSMDCRHCNKRIIYHVKTGETELKKIPPRECSSGMRFY